MIIMCINNNSNDNNNVCIINVCINEIVILMI